MTSPSNTPQDGDFVRYLERLTSNKLEPQLRQFMLTPAAREQAPPAGAPSTRPDKLILESLAETPFMTHLKWVLGVWIATRLLARLIPGLGFLFIPALVVYAGWVLFKVNRDTSSALFKKARQLTDTAARSSAAEVKKPKSTETKMRP